MRSAVAAFYWKKLPGARRVLDLGCGDGEIGRYKPAPDIDVVGLDSDPRCVSAAAAHERAMSWDLDQGRLPFDDGAFDAIVAKDILEHLQKPWETVKEIHRVLVPGGCVLASVICERPSRTWSDYTHVRGFTARTARLLFEHQGFAVESVWRMGPVPLASRFSMLEAVPYVLALPVFKQLWFASYELVARKAEVGTAASR